MASDALTVLFRRAVESELLAGAGAEHGTVHGRAFLDGLGAEVPVTIDAEPEEIPDPDVDALLETTARVVALGERRWTAIIDDVATEIEDAIDTVDTVAEQTDLRVDMSLASIVVFADAVVLRFAAPRQFPTASIMVQLDEDLTIEDVEVIDDDIEALAYPLPGEADDPDPR